MDRTIAEQYFNGQQLGEEREVGIEIEIEGRNIWPDRMSYWDVKGDGSLRGDSAEYVMKRPVKRSLVGRRLEYLMHKLEVNKAKLEPSERCGVHVHINCRELTNKQVINFAILYFILEDLLVKFCGPDREGNLFCLRIRDAEDLLNQLIFCKKENYLGYVMRNDYRYAAVNFSALSKFGSLEFRSLKTPENFEEIKIWADMLLRIKDKSLDFTEGREIIERASMMGTRRFIGAIMGRYAHLLECDDMADLLMEGVRRAQDIAYTPIKKGLSKRSKAATRPDPLRGAFGGRDPRDLRWQDINEAINVPPPQPRRVGRNIYDHVDPAIERWVGQGAEPFEEEDDHE